MLLEQTALCYLRGYPPLPRKYAFHLFLSAHRYYKCGLKERAIKNYDTALAIYGDLGWTLISDHLNFALGKQAAQRAEFEVAVDYFIKLLHKSRQSANIHRSYLAEFLYLFQQYATVADAESVSKKMASVPIPDLTDQSLRLTMKDPVIFATKGSSATNIEEVLMWEKMESEAFNALPKVGNDTGISKKEENFECAVGGMSSHLI